jgi:hypothetical protein
MMLCGGGQRGDALKNAGYYLSAGAIPDRPTPHQPQP